MSNVEHLTKDQLHTLAFLWDNSWYNDNIVLTADENRNRYM